MRFFKEKESVAQNMAFLALGASLCVVVSLLSALLPYGALFLMLAVPFVSASVAFVCKARYLPLFLVATFGACMGVSAWNFISTLFYLLPSLLTGTLYGLLWKKGVPSSINLFVCSLLQFALFLASLELVKALADGFDMVAFLLKFIAKREDEVARIIFPSFAYGYSLAQMALSELFLTLLMERFGKEETKEGWFPRLYPFFGALFLTIGVGIVFLSEAWGYVLLCLGLYWSVFSCFSFAPKVHPITWACLGVSLFGSLLLFALLYSKMPNHTGLILVAIPVVLTDFCVVLNQYLRRKGIKKEEGNS